MCSSRRKKGAGEDDGVGLRLSLWTLWADASILADGLVVTRVPATNMGERDPVWLESCLDHRWISIWGFNCEH